MEASGAVAEKHPTPSRMSDSRGPEYASDFGSTHLGHRTCGPPEGPAARPGDLSGVAQVAPLYGVELMVSTGLEGANVSSPRTG